LNVNIISSDMPGETLASGAIARDRGDEDPAHPAQRRGARP
jgi:hypothetical protein